MSIELSYARVLVVGAGGGIGDATADALWVALRSPPSLPRRRKSISAFTAF